MNLKALLFGLTTLFTIFSACKDDDGQTATVHIRLTDDPCDCQQVNLDIEEIVVKTSDDTTAWISLNTNAGIYDLLLFQNGIDTLIAFGPVPLAELKEVRFILGDDNTVMVDSVIYPLVTPSAQSSGLKVKIDKDLQVDVNSFILDFDAAESVKENNGTFMLHPVIKLI
jgi:hypothetical protein